MPPQQKAVGTKATLYRHCRGTQGLILGRRVGEAVLNHVVRHAVAALRPEDTLFRCGTDALVASISDSNANTAHLLGDRIRATFESNILNCERTDRSSGDFARRREFSDSRPQPVCIGQIRPAESASILRVLRESVRSPNSADAQNTASGRPDCALHNKSNRTRSVAQMLRIFCNNPLVSSRVPIRCRGFGWSLLKALSVSSGLDVSWTLLYLWVD